VVIINYCIYEVLWDDLKSVKNCRFFNYDKTRSLIAKLIFSKNKLFKLNNLRSFECTRARGGKRTRPAWAGFKTAEEERTKIM
jgi:hypothetical protein